MRIQPEMQLIKPGYKTSEFWGSFSVAIVALLVGSDVLGQQEANQLVDLSEQIISGLVALVTMVSYIVARYKLKRDAINGSATSVLPEKKSTAVELG